MADDPRSLAEAHWNALRKGGRIEARRLLGLLRTAGGGDEAPLEARQALAGALARAHWDAGRSADAEGARDLLDELRGHCRRPGADEAQRFELSKALGTAHWDAVRYGDARRAGRILGELRDLAKRGEATEGQRLALAEALAHEIRHHAGPQGDRERAASLLRDLRTLADRPHAPEEQRDALARALLDLHREEARRPEGERGGEDRLAALRALAERPEATASQHLACIEALQDAPWQTGLFGHRRRQEALLTAVKHAERASLDDRRAGALLGDALVRMHGKVRRAKDDAFADQLLDRLRVLTVRSDATIEQWLTLAGGVCDGLWIAETFANREFAEELEEILHLVTGPVEATVRQRMTLAGLLVGAHHRAVRHEDGRVSKALLTLLHAWAVREGATTEEGEVLGHGLRLAHEHACAGGETALAAKIEAALAALPSPPARAGATALQDLAAGS
ncbi:MAG: hypothetical protein P1V36_16905 [Planctomycetota bacterium]|nr:hypothetical protein [Planctomycetota bacterium]